MGEKILCIEDCLELQKTITEYLKIDGYNVVSSAGDHRTLSIFEETCPDLVLLDLLLPDTDGLTLLKQLRARRENLPVIMISGRAGDIDRIIGLESGADDYIAKPFLMRELSARIKAVLKRTRAEPSDEQKEPITHASIIKFDHWTMDRQQYQVFSEDGKSADLTTSEFTILEKLITSKNKAHSRQVLFELLHDHAADVSDRAIDILITRIRAKLGDNPKTPKYIKTLRNVGYIFIGKTQTP